MRSVCTQTIWLLLLSYVVWTSHAEAGCWSEWGVKVCNWESVREDIQGVGGYIETQWTQPLRQTIESLTGSCADSHEDRKARLTAATQVTVINPEKPRQLVYYINGIATTLYEAREEAKALSEKINRPVGLIHNPTIKEGDTGTASAVLTTITALSSMIIGPLPVLFDIALADLQESLYDREWPNMFPHGCHTQFNPTTKQVTGLLYEKAKAEPDKPLIIVSHSQGNLIVRNGLMGAMRLGLEDWLKGHVTWVVAAPPLTEAEMHRARYQIREVYLDANDCIHLVRDLGGGACDPLFRTHNFTDKYLPVITPWLLSRLAIIESSNEAALEAIYQAVLGRALDASGAATWTNELARGLTLGQVRDSVAKDVEAQQNLEAIYQAVLVLQRAFEM